MLVQGPVGALLAVDDTPSILRMVTAVLSPAFKVRVATSGSQALTLVRQCADVLPSTPIIAAGGIMDGRAIAGALALGAQAVQMGTAFLTCPESGIGPAYRQALTQAGPTDTRTTRIFSGRPARGIVNTMMDRLRADERSVPPYPVQNALTGVLRRAAAQAGRADHLSLWAGQGVAQVRPMPAAELMAVLAQELQAASA